MIPSSHPEPVIEVFMSLLNRKSMLRTYLNLSCKNHKLTGHCLDLGGRGNSSYYKYFNICRDAHFKYADLSPIDGSEPINVMEKLPYGDSSFDSIICFNLFEHLPKRELTASEMIRILRPGGKIYFSTPFLYPFHPDPDDYFRPTDREITLLFEQHQGVECIEMRALGEGVLTSAISMFCSEAFGPIKGVASAFLYLLCLTWIDRLVAKRRHVHGRNTAARYAVGFFAVFQLKKQ